MDAVPAENGWIRLRCPRCMKTFVTLPVLDTTIYEYEFPTVHRTCHGEVEALIEGGEYQRKMDRILSLMGEPSQAFPLKVILKEEDGYLRGLSVHIG